MKKPKKHEPAEVIHEYLGQLIAYTRRFCRSRDPQSQAGGLSLLRELFRARRRGWMTPEQEKQYEGLLKAVRPQFLAIVKEGQVRVPPVVAAEMARVHAKARRSAKRRTGGEPRGADEDDA
jgi:hypothetical protein